MEEQARLFFSCQLFLTTLLPKRTKIQFVQIYQSVKSLILN